MAQRPMDFLGGFVAAGARCGEREREKERKRKREREQEARQVKSKARQEPTLGALSSSPN